MAIITSAETEYSNIFAGIFYFPAVVQFNTFGAKVPVFTPSQRGNPACYSSVSATKSGVEAGIFSFHGWAGRGEARLGRVRRGIAGQGVARQGKGSLAIIRLVSLRGAAGSGGVGLGLAGYGLVRLGLARQGAKQLFVWFHCVAWPGLARLGVAWQGGARFGLAWRGTAR